MTITDKNVNMIIQFFENILIVAILLSMLLIYTLI